MSTEDTARDEFYAARKAARDIRRSFAYSVLSAFVGTMQGVMRQYLTARTEGVSRDDAAKGLEAELRAAWPKSVSKFKAACDACDDTGWREMACWDGHRCGREVCAKNPERQHLYVVICDCPKGDRFRAKAYTTDDQLTTVGKTAKKRSGFSRMGR